MSDDKYKYKIVNGKLESAKNCEVSFNEYGLPIYIDDYGMGACYYSLIKSKDEQQIRQSIDDTIWAVERLKWATENAPNECPELLKIIVVGTGLSEVTRPSWIVTLYAGAS